LATINRTRERGFRRLPQGLSKDKTGISVSLKSGRKIFVTTRQHASPGKLLNEVLLKAIIQYFKDTVASTIQALEKVIVEAIAEFVPTVALKEGRLRSAVIGFIHSIRQSLDTSEFIAAEGLPGAEGAIMAKITVDFQLLFAQLDYAVFHTVEFRKKDVYEDATTGGTAPFSTLVFSTAFMEIVLERVIFILSTLGWKLSSQGPGASVILSIGGNLL